MEKRFSYLWEYIVKENYLNEFKEVYGPEGRWVKLFKQADGYITTDLHQDKNNPLRFISVDFWLSLKHRDDFHNKFSVDIKDLDGHCEKFTDSEQHLGDFDVSTMRF